MLRVNRQHAQVRPRRRAERLLDGHPARDRNARRLQRRQQDRAPPRRLPQQARDHPRPRIVSQSVSQSLHRIEFVTSCSAADFSRAAQAIMSR